jgi:ABC-type transporter Mla MlaB component
MSDDDEYYEWDEDYIEDAPDFVVSDTLRMDSTCYSLLCSILRHECRQTNH